MDMTEDTGLLCRDIGRYCAIIPARIRPESDLVGDLGIMGDDGYELIDYLSRKYRADLSGIDFSPYFGGEPPDCSLRMDSQNKPLRVMDLLDLLRQAPRLASVDAVPVMPVGGEDGFCNWRIPPLTWVRIAIGILFAFPGFLAVSFCLFFLSVTAMRHNIDFASFSYLVLGALSLRFFVLSWPDYREFPAFFSRATACKFCAVGIEICLGEGILLNGLFAVFSVAAGETPVASIVLALILLALLVLNSWWLYRLFLVVPRRR